jgi:hypothetical protein
MGVRFRGGAPRTDDFIKGILKRLSIADESFNLCSKLAAESVGQAYSTAFTLKTVVR